MTVPLSKKTEFKRNNVKTVYNGTETLKLFLGPRIWEIGEGYIKKCNSLEEFKLKTKLWIPENCPYRLCRRFLSQVGFLQHAFQFFMTAYFLIFTSHFYFVFKSILNHFCLLLYFF